MRAKPRRSAVKIIFWDVCARVRAPRAAPRKTRTKPGGPQSPVRRAPTTRRTAARAHKAHSPDAVRTGGSHHPPPTSQTPPERRPRFPPFLFTFLGKILFSRSRSDTRFIPRKSGFATRQTSFWHHTLVNKCFFAGSSETKGRTAHAQKRLTPMLRPVPSVRQIFFALISTAPALPSFAARPQLSAAARKNTFFQITK